LINLAPEAIGTAFTIAIIDWLSDLRQDRAEVRRIAFGFLHDVDHATWVWQGGRRSLDVSELLGLLGNVSELDPMPWFLQNLLMRIGSRAADTIRLNGAFLCGSPSLQTALERLEPLAGIRDGGINSARDLADTLREASVLLLAVLGAETPTPSLDSEWQRDASEPSQHWRHFGRRLHNAVPQSGHSGGVAAPNTGDGA